MLSLQQVQLIALIVLGFYKSVVQAQVVGLGTGCPSMDAVTDFKLQQFVGQWYENRKYISDHQVGQVCVTLDLTKTSDNDVKIQTIGTRRLTGKKTVISGTARLTVPSIGKFHADFPKNALAINDTPYLVLGTDYTSYSVIWSCTTRGPFYHLYTLWIFTRDLLPSQSTIDKALEVARKNNLNLGKLRKTSQQHC